MRKTDYTLVFTEFAYDRYTLPAGRKFEEMDQELRNELKDESENAIQDAFDEHQGNLPTDHGHLVTSFPHIISDVKSTSNSPLPAESSELQPSEELTDHTTPAEAASEGPSSPGSAPTSQGWTAAYDKPEELGAEINSQVEEYSLNDTTDTPSQLFKTQPDKSPCDPTLGDDSQFDGKMEARLDGDSARLQEDSAMDDASRIDETSQADMPTETPSGTGTPTKERRTRNTVNKQVKNSLPEGVTADCLFEYSWPRDDSHADHYLLQEQVSEFLQVKSFRRKYPDLIRRQIEISERNFLKDLGIVTEMQCDLGLTALRSDEVCDIMSKDYPEKFDEYAKVLQKKEAQKHTLKQQQLQASTTIQQPAVPLNKQDMKKLMDKATKSAALFNQFLQNQKREERRAYFDIGTGIVQTPMDRKRVVPPEFTNPSLYPVKILPNQYQDCYKKYTPDELNYLPLKTVMYQPPRRINNPYRPLPPDPDEIREELLRQQTELLAQEAACPAVVSTPPRSPARSGPAPPAPATPRKTRVLVGATCMICIHVDNRKGEAESCIKCNQCGKESHPTCNEITEEMLVTVLTYKWMCMDCKVCGLCSDPGNEDKMIVCDNCDRGFHTFCVGLDEIPKESWVCPQCVERKRASTPR